MPSSKTMPGVFMVAAAALDITWSWYVIPPISQDHEEKDHDKEESNEEEDLEVPDGFECPITSNLMVDPVITSDGHTYERYAIERWLSTNDTSPLTGARLISKNMVPNIALRKMIQTFREEHSIPEPEPEPEQEPELEDELEDELEAELEEHNPTTCMFCNNTRNCQTCNGHGYETRRDGISGCTGCGGSGNIIYGSSGICAKGTGVCQFCITSQESLEPFTAEMWWDRQHPNQRR